jgi:hypothetical protein
MPPSVAKKIKFVRGLFDKQTVLAEIQLGGSQREKFLVDLDKIVYKQKPTVVARTLGT